MFVLLREGKPLSGTGFWCCENPWYGSRASVCVFQLLDIVLVVLVRKKILGEALLHTHLRFKWGPSLYCMSFTVCWWVYWLQILENLKIMVCVYWKEEREIYLKTRKKEKIILKKKKERDNNIKKKWYLKLWCIFIYFFCFLSHFC